MSKDQVFDENDEQQIRELLMGRRIVEVSTDFPEMVRRYSFSEGAAGRLILDDGTRIYVIPNEGGCICGAGDYGLEHLASTPNVITRVELAAEGPEGEEYEYAEAPTSYRIYVWSENKKISAVQVDGDDGNGYYGTGYELVVIPGGAV